MRHVKMTVILLSGIITLGLISITGIVGARDGMVAGKGEMKMDEIFQTATFAGGCFWCMEPPFDKLEGVISTTSGYAGGSEEAPTYKDVSSGKTGHAEAVQVQYDPEKISYGELLEVFWRQIDPTTPNRQFVDVGRQYRTAVFYHNDEQRRLAEESKTAMEKSGRFDGPIVTEITPVGKFWPAEEYHQDYYMKNPIRYKYYRFRSGRDQYLKKIWGE